MAKKITTIEGLATLIQQTMASKEDVAQVGGGVAEIREKMEHMHTEMRDGFHAVNRRIDLLHEDISDLPDIREEVRDHGERLTRVERKVGVAR
ncbi:MAG: hypothetical protein AAB916_00260 [Patescibacteria group bacterium]